MKDTSDNKNSSLSSQATEVTEGSTVIMEYSVRLANGKEVDSSARNGGAVSFICGENRFPEPVEKGILGMQPGDTKVIPVEPVYTYGFYDPKKQILVASERVKEKAEPGKIIKAPDEFGIRRQAVVRAVWNGAILVDFNHPLAGQTLYFNINLKGIKLSPMDLGQ
jgi:FKBP-type peptidyl-prolyl cis-trans isomerase 2